jgi:hypothetical protein
LFFTINEEIIPSFSEYKAYINEKFNETYYDPLCDTSFVVFNCFFDNIEERVIIMDVLFF